MDIIQQVKRHLGYAQLLAIGFLVVIALGTFLLALPISSKDNTWTSFIGSLFTATSATCVTGLVMFDTWTHFSIFGQIVILLLIQIGGLGFFTMLGIVNLMFRRKVSTHQRRLLLQASGYFKLSGINRMIKLIVIGTAIIELLGTIVLSIRFVPMYGPIGIYYALFHSVSAFCNAGFDLNGMMGVEYGSFVAFNHDYLVLITLTILIILGGIGFIVWNDVINHKHHLSQYSFHSKLALISTGFLLLVGTGLYLIFEFKNPNTIGNMSLPQKILNAFFQSTTTRTAGFNAIEQGNLTAGSFVLTLVLMIIGGSPCSTAGGIKTTTIAILILNSIAASSNRREVTSFNRRVDEKIIKQAAAIAMIYLVLVLVSLLIIMPSLESLGYDLKSGIYVVFSAIGTVGLARDVTAELGLLCHIILILLMYTGRIGGLTITLFFSENRVEPIIQKPLGEPLVG